MGPIVAAIKVVAAIAAANTVKGLVVRTLLIAGAKMLFQALTPKPKGGAGGDAAASGVEQQRQIGEATPRAIALGWTIVAGQECALWASGDSDDNRFNTRVIVISDWPTTLQKVWVRGRELTFEGDINTGWFACNQYRAKSGAARLWMRFVKGDWNQAADSQLISYATASATWTSDDRLRGVSALLIRREYDVDAFQSGAPDNDDLRVEVKNAPVYDWRDVTQNINDVTTWKPSENPIVLVENALCLLRAPAQYSPGSTDPIVGPGLEFSRRPLAKLTAMANICDELVSGQPRYRAGGVVNAAMTGREIIARFAAASAGSWVSSGDGGYLRPGFVPAPVMDIPAGALKADASDRYDPWSRPDDVVNTVIGSYPDPAQAWQITPLPPATDTAWVATDGGVRTAQEDLSFCPYRDQAWRISVRKARGFRLMGARDFSGPHWLIELEPGDVVTAPDPALPYLATKWWMVQRAVLLAKQDGLTVQLTLNEIDSAIDAAPPALGAAATFTPSSLSRALAVPPVTIGQRVVSGGSGGQYPELTFLIPDTASQASGVVQLQGPATANDNALLAAAQIRNIGLSRGLLHGEPVVPGWYRWRAAGRDVDGSVGAFDASWQAAVQVTAPLVAGEAGAGLGGAPILNELVTGFANQSVDSEFVYYDRTWNNLFASAGTWTVTRFQALGATQVLRRSSSNAPAGTQFNIGQATASCLPVSAGQRVEVSAIVAGTNVSTAALAISWLDASGGFVTATTVTNGSGDTPVGGFVEVPSAPAGIALAQVTGVYFVNADSTYTEGRLARPLIRLASANQSVLSTYVPGPVERNADQTSGNVAAAFLGQGNRATTNVYRQSSAPSSPVQWDEWQDTSTSPVIVKLWIYGAWVAVGEEGATVGSIVGGNFKFPDGSIAPIGRVDNIYNPIGTNQVINSDYNQGTTGFFFTAALDLTGSGINTSAGRNLSGWHGIRNVLWSSAQVTLGTLSPAGGGYFYGWGDNGFYGGLSNLNRYSTRVKKDDRVYVGYRIGPHRASRAGFEVRWFDKDGNLIGTAFKDIDVDASLNFANGDPSKAALVEDFFIAPDNAAFASTAPRVTNIFAGVSSVYLFQSDPHVCVVPPNQTTAPVYNAGPVDRAADRTGENTAGAIVGQGTEATKNRYRQSSTPASPQDGDTWEDTSTTPALIKKRIAGAWVFQGEEGADITARAQRSIVAEFPVIEIKEGEAGHTGNRTVTHTVFKGTTSISGGTFSLPAVTLGTGSATINSSTGTVTLSSIVQSGSYVIRYVHTDGYTTDLDVNVSYIPTPPSAVSSKIARDDTATGIASGSYSAVLTGTINSGPAGLARLELTYLPITWTGSSTNFQFRLTRAGVQLAETAVFTGIDGAGDIGDFLTEIQAMAGFYTVAAGTAVWALEAKRTSGSGTISSAAGELVVSQTET